MACAERGEVVAGRFEIEDLAGSGGMGEVYRAVDRCTGERVALKLLPAPDAQMTARFAREARLLDRLRHPGIVRYVAHGTTTDGQSYLAMEWLSGEDLSSRLDRGPLTIAESMSIATQTAQALGFAHAQGVVHRDVKPSNFFLCQPPNGCVELPKVKVLDFGIARPTCQATQILTGTGMMLGTPCYMAPEQAKGSTELDSSADVFALGCVLFQCLAGRPPFVGDHPLAILAKIIFEEPPLLRSLRADVPAGLDELIGCMLAKTPQHRPANGSAVYGALSNVMLPPTERFVVDSARAGVLTRGELRLVSVIVARASAVSPTVNVHHASSMSAIPATPDADLRQPSALSPIPATPDADLRQPSALSPIRATARSVAARTDTASGFAETSSAIERAKTVVSPGNHGALESLEQTTRSFGARLETLADGSLVTTICCHGSALDQAARAARCALALRDRLPRAAVALTTGRGVLAGRLPVGEAIDRAVTLLEAKGDEPAECSEGAIRVDDVTAGLLDIRFELSGQSNGPLLLHRERETFELSRTLLGKPTPCVGRNRELSTLIGVFEECISESVARVALITAPAGAGKSRLFHEFLLRLRARPDAPQIWIARGDPMRAGSPFGMLAQVLRQQMGILNGESLPARHRKIHARVARHVKREQSRVADFLAELVGAPVPDEGSIPLRAARENAQLMGDQMCRAWEEFAAAECSEQPLLLVLEDLHWGDLPSVKFVDVALRNLRDSPLMVLALARPEVHDAFPELWAGREVVEMRLGELTRKASEKLVRHVLGEQFANATVDRIVTQAQGNPFYLEELIRAVAAGTGERLPETVLAMVQARIEALSADARRVLRAASIFGQVFWEEGLRALIGKSGSADLASILSDLVEEEIVFRHREAKFPDAHEYVFCHALVREAAYAMLTTPDRALGHRLAGRWLESSGETDFVVLAEHYDRGKEPGQAGSHYRRAAEQALEGNDLLAVLDHTERGLRCASAANAPAELFGAIHFARAAAQICRGDLSQAEQSGREAVRHFSIGEAAWFRSMTQIIVATGRQMHVDGLLASIAAASVAPAEPPARPAQLACLCRGVVALLIAGRFEEADRLLTQVERIFERGLEVAPPPSKATAQVPSAAVNDIVPTPNEISAAPREVATAAELYRARAFRSLYMSDLGASLAEFDHATAAFEQANDRRNACLMTCNLGVVYKTVGEYDQAEAALRKSLGAAEKLGMQDVFSAVLHNLGMVLAHLGRIDEALAVERQAAIECKAQGDPRLEGGSRCYLSCIEWLAGNYEAAEREARAANDLLRVSPPTRVSALASLSRALLAQGRSAEALATAEEGRQIVAGATHVEEGEAFIRLVHAEALAKKGDLPAARLAIDEACNRLLQQADKIQDSRWRRSFLENVPENAMTFALRSTLFAGG